MSSLASIVKLFEVRQPEGAQNSWLINHDLLPVPLEHRKWKSWNMVSFWVADSFNLNTFMIASSMIGAGLTWWQAWLAVIVGYSIAAFFLVLNAYPGAVYHIIFPTYVRASFGTFGGLWPTFNRAGMACIWYGVQSSIGGSAVFVLLRAIFPSITRLDKDLSGIDVGHYIGFVLFSAISLIAIWFPLHSIRHLFTLKAVVAPIAGLALFGWTMKRAGGAGDLLSAPPTVSGSTLGWLFVANLAGCISNMATLITNAVDFASRAQQPRNVIIPQLIALPATFSVVSLFGILIASATPAIFGEFVWSPLSILEGFLDLSQSSGTRAGCAFISIGFIIAQLGTNIAANSISAGCDLTSLCPRFINIRRGGYICATVGFVMMPWKLLESTSTFASYLSAYSVFLSSICGVMLANYYVVAGRRVKVFDLYVSGGIYHYFHGVNLRAYAAYILGLAPNMPGFIGAVGHSVPMNATRLYYLSWFNGVIVSGLVYILLNKVFPTEQPTAEEDGLYTLGVEGSIKHSLDRDSYSEEKDSEIKEGAYATGHVSIV